MCGVVWTYGAFAITEWDIFDLVSQTAVQLCADSNKQKTNRQTNSSPGYWVESSLPLSLKVSVLRSISEPASLFLHSMSGSMNLKLHNEGRCVCVCITSIQKDSGTTQVKQHSTAHISLYSTVHHLHLQFIQHSTYGTGQHTERAALHHPWPRGPTPTHRL